jgi:hypothetical protein
MNPRHPQTKHLEGPVRELQPGQWSQNQQEARTMARQFTAAGGMVPTNIQNFLSTQPAASPVAYDAIGQGLVPRVSPYGDGRQVVAPETAVLTTPAAMMPQVAPPAPGAELQANTPGYGFAAAASPLNRIDAAQFRSVPPPLGEGTPAPALGMSTGVSLLGSGPRRDVPRTA